MAPVAKKRRRDGAKAEKSEARSNRKQTWWRDPRRVRGSIGEGQGFAFWRKQKIQRDYKKLLKKNKNTCSQSKFGYTDDYPEHLKHLYLAEEELLKKQQKQKKDRPPILEDKDSETVKCNLIQRKFKTSNQKAKEEYEKIKSEQEKQKEDTRKKKEEREKAQKLYKQKKMETYKILSKRTRKGQPNLNVQMEYLLQKIQQKP